MAYQITLSEDDYAALAAASTQTGEPIEQLVHEAIAARYIPQPPARQIGNYQYPIMCGAPTSDARGGHPSPRPRSPNLAPGAGGRRLVVAAPGAA